MDSEKDVTIYKLRQVIDLLASQKKEDSLTTDDYAAFSVAKSYFGEKYKFDNYSQFKSNLPISAVSDLISKLEEKEEKEQKKEVQENSIPPELESLVAEYQQNQALLESEAIKSNSQRSVAEQVKIAIAHSKIKDLALANRERRLLSGEKFQKEDAVFTKYGSPKSNSKTTALSSSYTAIKEVAFTYSGFVGLSPQVQNYLISQAVDLNTVGIVDIDAAIQTATLLLDPSKLDDKDRKNLATIPGGFVASVYQTVTTSNKNTLEYESKISANEDEILSLQKKGKTAEIKVLIEENQHLSTFLENQSARLANEIDKKTELFKDYEKSREVRLSKDPDLIDRIESANKNIATIQNNLQNNGVTPHFYTPMDDAHLLEEAYRRDFPGELNPHAGYDAEYAAALINTPKTEDPNYSPQALLLAGKNLTPELLSKAREFALKNPNSSLGKLYQTRKDIFDSARLQIRKIVSSPLGKEITNRGAGLQSISKFFNGISDKLPGGFRGTFRAIQDPFGALRSWAGRKAGQQLLKQISLHITNETLKSTAELLVKEGLKKTVTQLTSKALVKASSWIATKLAISASLESVNGIAPGLGVILDIAAQAIIWIAEKTIGFFKKTVDNASIALFGEKTKFRDLLAVPVVGAATLAGGVTTFFTSLTSATAVAASSAVGIVVAGTLIGFMFYITSIVVAPLISTLVQLESETSTNVPSSCADMPWPFEGVHPVTQGPNVGICTHHGTISQSADFSVPLSTPILSMTSGKVISAISSSSGYGNHVIIEAETDEGESFTIIYGHFSSLSVSTGDSVEAGQEIGLSGSTGYSTGPHLHLGYIGGIEYNSCPAGNFQINEGCCNGETTFCNQP